MENKKIGIYIHIPFCKQKCYYCDFISFCNKDDLIENYINALKKEIESQKIKEEIDTIYIGGGTPSYLESKYIVELMEEIKKKDVLKEAEITIEVNPGTVTEEKLKNYKKSGINRLSIGLQTSKDELLKEIGRIHDFEQFLETYKIARKVGFKNINVDLMIGLPNQKIKDIKETLQKIVDLQPEHISVYSLIVEENTPIAKKIDTGELELPDEELERNMYWYVKSTLELNGYVHYEISNFAKMDYESKHNMNCWAQSEYIGFGTAAHSYINYIRYSNTENVEEYIQNVNCRSFEKNININEIQSDDDIRKEFMLLGLRKIDGVKISDFKNKFGDNPIYLYRNILQKLYNEDLIKVDENNIRLTNKGLDLANLVWEEFV